MSLRFPSLAQASVAAALIVHAAAAHASVLTQQTLSFSLTPGTASFSIANDGGVVTSNTNNSAKLASQALSFVQFDASLGTLTGVAISFLSSYQATSFITVAKTENFDPNPVTGYFADGLLDFKLAGGGLFADLSSSQSVEAACNAVGSGPVHCSKSATISDASFQASTTASSLAAFIGSGNINLSASLADALSARVTPDNGTGYADNATMTGALDSAWSGNVTVSYTYDAAPTPSGVPEPLTLPLVAAGLLGVALFRRR
jgi:hypothetical protein